MVVDSDKSIQYQTWPEDLEDRDIPRLILHKHHHEIGSLEYHKIPTPAMQYMQFN